MRLYFTKSNGGLAVAKYDRELFEFDESTLSPFDFYDVDEMTPTTKGICREFANTAGKIDDAGLYKYSLLDGKVVPRTGWVERVNEIL